MDLAWDLIRQMSPETSLVLPTWALALATIGLIIVGILYGKKQAKTQEELAQLQKKLVEEQMKTTEVQKIALQATERSAELQQKSLVMAAMFKINEMLNNATSRQNRKIIFDVAAGGSHSLYDEIAGKVSGEFDQVGAMIQVSEHLKRMYMSMHVRKTAKSWHVLERWVKEQRPIRHDDHFREHFEMIGKEAVVQWKREYPNELLEIHKINAIP